MNHNSGLKQLFPFLIYAIFIWPCNAQAESVEMRIRRLQGDQQDKQLSNETRSQAQLNAGTKVVATMLDKLRRSGIMFRADGHNVPGVRQVKNLCKEGSYTGIFSPVALALTIKGPHGEECVSVELDSDPTQYWTVVGNPDAWCRHPSKNMIHMSSVRLVSPKDDTLYKVVLKHVQMIVDAPKVNHWTENPLCPEGAETMMTPEQFLRQ